MRYLASALVGAALLLGVQHVTNLGPTCYEDEIQVWTGEAHDGCVALDDLWTDWNEYRQVVTVHWYDHDVRTP